MMNFILKHMINVSLYGILAKKFGSFWELDVASVMEIFQAIEANYYNSNKYFNNFNKFFTHFIVYIDGKPMPAHLLKSKILKSNSKVEILPVVQGGLFWFAIIGIVLIVLSFVLVALLSPKAPTDIKTNSTILGGVRNVLNRNVPIPIGYGRMRVGSSVISNDIIVTPINQTTKNFETAYGSLTF